MDIRRSLETSGYQAAKLAAARNAVIDVEVSASVPDHAHPHRNPLLHLAWRSTADARAAIASPFMFKA